MYGRVQDRATGRLADLAYVMVGVLVLVQLFVKEESWPDGVGR
jgi:hypothetical protein